MSHTTDTALSRAGRCLALSHSILGRALPVLALGCLAAAPPWAAPAAAQNLIANANYETASLGPWQKYPPDAPGVVAVENCCANHTPGGTWNAYIMPQGQYVEMYQWVSVVPHRRYRLEAWVATNGQAFLPNLGWWSNADGGRTAGCGGTRSVFPNYVRLTCDFMVPEGTTQFNVHIAGTAAPGLWAVVDDWSLTQLNNVLATPSDRWKLEIWTNRTFTGASYAQRYAIGGPGGFTFNWGTGGPTPSPNVDNFAVRFTRRAHFATATTYTFSTTTDDGVRLWVDGALLIDDWRDSAIHTRTAARFLNTGWHDLRMDYYENAGGAYAALAWTPAPTIARANLYGSMFYPGEWIDTCQGPTQECLLPAASRTEWNRRSKEVIASSLRGTNVHLGFAWSDIEAQQGVYDWTIADEHVNQSRALNLEMFSFSGNTPFWALPPKCGPGIPAPCLPQDNADHRHQFPPREEQAMITKFQSFFTALAARYCGRVRYYEFWNEPNGCSWVNGCSNGGDPQAQLYVTWLARWYGAMKAGCSDTVLAVGGLDCNRGTGGACGNYLDWLHKHGAGRYYDAVAIHPYGIDDATPEFATGFNWLGLDEVITRLPDDKTVWINEYGWATPSEATAPVGSQTKGAMIDWALTTVENQYPRVFMMEYHLLTDLPDDAFVGAPPAPWGLVNAPIINGGSALPPYNFTLRPSAARFRDHVRK